MEKELLFYSGGPDSTVLLKYFLKQNKNLLVVYFELGWSYETQPRLKFQKEKVNQLINYFKKNYREFEYMDGGIFLNIPVNPPLQFGTDDQWLVFLGSLICRVRNIKKMWHASFTYNWNNRKAFGKEPPYWLLQKDVQPIINFATFNDPRFRDLQFIIPKIYYDGKEIDQFKTKKEAWNYLEPELKKLVRSCESGFTFCGKCYKCQTWIDHKMVDENKKIL